MKRCTGICALALALVATPAEARSTPQKRIEMLVRSTAPDARAVRESYVSLYAPLPPADGPHPAACDRIGYLRFRSAKGPRVAARAKAIFAIMPGIFAGASMLDQTARNIVRRAASRRRRVEVWTLDRRSNCLEDHWGLNAAARAHNPRLAIEYYYGGAKVNGRRFRGFVTEQQAAWLGHVGLAQTVRDEYTVISHELSPRVRRRKLLCGGHSLGGPLTTAFADWDFGAGTSRAIPGYRQCAAFFALDTRLTLAAGGGGSSGGSSGPGDLGAGAQLAAQGGKGSPYINAPPFTPETIEAPEIVGVGAYYAGGRQSYIQSLLPHDTSFELSDRLLFSRDALNFAIGVPNIRDFRITNAAALGAIFDDNSTPIVILRAGLGLFTGGPVAEKNFPLPYGSANQSGLLGGGRLMVPAQPHGPLYRWRNYDQIRGKPITLDNQGHPYTAPVDEVSDIHQFGRVMLEAPADFVEQYFPTKLVADLQAAGNGERGGELAALRYDGIGRRPAFYVDAQNGIEAGVSAPPLSVRKSGWVIAAGYHHIDVATAAFRQSDGRPEIVSSSLVRFARWVLPVHARRHRHRGGQRR